MLDLSPTGTARRLFDPSLPRSPEERFLARLLGTKIGQELGPPTLHVAWEVASLATDLDDDERTHLALLIVLSMHALSQGATGFPLAACPILLQQMFPEADEAAKLAKSIRALVENGKAPAVVGRTVGAYTPFILVDGVLYHHRMSAQEDRLSAAIRRVLARPRAEPVDNKLARAFHDVLAKPATLTGDPSSATVALEARQQYAVLAAAAGSFTLISGGPGTGKTTIVVSILRLLARLGVSMESVVLAAPTGKAANRMGQAVESGLRRIPAPGAEDVASLTARPQPQTLHRLLGYSEYTNRFRYDERNRLPYRVIVVDEASMVDLALMDQLFRSVPDDARLILLGDADQLPSVEAGAVFRDLMPEAFTFDAELAALMDAPPKSDADGPSTPLSRSAVRLVHSYRMDPSDPAGRAVLSAALAMQSGDADRLFTGASEASLVVRGDAKDAAFEGVEWLSSDLDSFLRCWVDARVRNLEGYSDLTDREYVHGPDGFIADDRSALSRLFAHQEEHRLLCVTRVLPTGADAVNARIREMLHPEMRLRDGEFLSGEPVMMQRNDYAKGIFNGDQGIVLRVRGKTGRSHLMAVFARDGEFVPFALTALRGEVRPAHAITVHKSQGSEYRYVGLILPAEDMPLLTRELLYTAVTRAKRSVVLVGTEERIRQGVGRRLERYSGLRRKVGAG